MGPASRFCRSGTVSEGVAVAWVGTVGQLGDRWMRRAATRAPARGVSASSAAHAQSLCNEVAVIYCNSGRGADNYSICVAAPLPAPSARYLLGRGGALPSL